MNSSEQYSQFIKPEWAPPAFLFGPVWAVLYLIIIVSFSFVFYKIYNGDMPKIVALPFILNLIFNLLFTYFQFGLKNNILATIDIFLVLATLIWVIIVIYPHISWVAYVNIPYFIWVSFATALQVSITYLNC
jgi:translocator protein